MTIDIPEQSLDGFNEQAREKLTEAMKQFTLDLIDESNRIEADRNVSRGTPQITSPMVLDANILIRRRLVRPKIAFGAKILRVFASFSSLAVGILYNHTKLQDPVYMVIFLGVAAVAILSVIISTMKE